MLCAGENEKNENFVNLCQGKIVVFTRERGSSVNTDQGDIAISSGSTIIIEENSRKTVKMSNLNGSASMKTIANKTFSCNPGERVAIASASESDEELIPVEGDDVTVQAKIVFSGASAALKARVSKFNVEHLWETNLMLNCTAAIQLRNKYRKEISMSGQPHKSTSSTQMFQPIAFQHSQALTATDPDSADIRKISSNGLVARYMGTSAQHLG